MTSVSETTASSSNEPPFGGVGQSGFGKEHGIEALEHYMESKSVVVKRSAGST